MRIKLLVYSIFFAIFLILGTTQASAQINTGPQEFQAALEACDTETNGNCVTSIYLNHEAWNWVCAMTGSAGQFRFCDALLDNSSNSSVIGFINARVTTLYDNPAADSSMYIADLGSRIGIVSPAYAQVQGIGFSGLAPLLSIWTGVRNLAYAFLVLALVVIGFMIMFRRRIDPRTVMTVQTALPRIIVTLLIVTFSYPLVGLMIDLMYVIIGIGYVAIGDDTPLATLGIASSTGFADLGTIWSVGLGSIDDIYRIFWGSTPEGVIGTGIGVGTLIGGALANIPGGIIGGLLGGAVGALPVLIVLLAFLFALLRIFFMLVSAYIQVLVSVIFAPLQLMFGAIPGNDAFMGWFRNLVANLSVFAITAILMVFTLLLDQKLGGDSSLNLWAPPGLSGNTANGISGLIGFGIALSIPSIVGSVKEALKAKPAVQAGAGVLLGPLGSTVGAGQQALSTFASFKHITRKGQ